MLDPWFKQEYPIKHMAKWLYWPWAEYRTLRDAHLVLFTTAEEMALARARMNQVFGAIGEDAQQTATEIVAQHEAWRASTVLYATTTNEETKQKLAAEMLKYEVWRNMARESKQDNNFGNKGGGASNGR